MNDFTASNGVHVSISHGDYLSLASPDRDFQDSIVGERAVEALREFFQAEADERLGRWRWRENPDYVVYPHGVGVRVVSDRAGKSLVTDRERASQWGTEPTLFGAARAYFDAHPEPKPWHDAKAGEVWELTIDDEKPAAFYPSKSLDRQFTPVMPSTGITAVPFEWPLITAGRRVYPEGESD